MAGRLAKIPTVKHRGRYDGFRPTCWPERLEEPLKLKRPSTIAVSLMGDLFHVDVPNWFVNKIWAVMSDTPQHTYIVLTKRPWRLRNYLEVQRLAGSAVHNTPLPNVWLGTSASTNADVDRNAPKLLRSPAAHRWLSLEPLLEEVYVYAGIDWVVVGCESGSGRRPCKPEWIQSVVEQCDSAGVPVFVKQVEIIDGRVSTNPAEWPKWARRREVLKCQR
jgi:protein gp37